MIPDYILLSSLDFGSLSLVNSVYVYHFLSLTLLIVLSLDLHVLSLRVEHESIEHLHIPFVPDPL